MNFNKAIIVGNLTRDPEVKSLPSGQQVANFGVATNRFYTDQANNRQQSTEFHNIVAFGKLADICSKYLTKGSIVLVEGRIQTRSWQGTDGQKKYRTEIIMESMQLGPKNSGAGAGSSSAYKNPKISKSTKEDDDIPVIDMEESSTKDNINIDDIPF